MVSCDAIHGYSKPRPFNWHSPCLWCPHEVCKGKSTFPSTNSAQVSLQHHLPDSDRNQARGLRTRQLCSCGKPNLTRQVTEYLERDMKRCEEDLHHGFLDVNVILWNLLLVLIRLNKNYKNYVKFAACSRRSKSWDRHQPCRASLTSSFRPRSEDLCHHMRSISKRVST